MRLVFLLRAKMRAKDLAIDINLYKRHKLDVKGLMRNGIKTG
jgi:hypothetical protein